MRLTRSLVDDLQTRPRDLTRLGPENSNMLTTIGLVIGIGVLVLALVVVGASWLFTLSLPTDTHMYD